MVLWVAVDRPAVAPAHNVIGVQTGGRAGKDLGKVHPKFIGYLINQADGDILPILLVAPVYLWVHLQLCGQALYGVIAGFPQFPQAGADLIDLIHGTRLLCFQISTSLDFAIIPL